MRDMTADLDVKSCFDLAGRTAVVTGGASGLGLAIVKCLAAAGARVIAVGSRDPGAANPELAKYCRGDVSYRQFDIRDHAKTGEFAASVGRIDILINNAGNHCKKPIETMTIDEYRNVLELHLVAGFALAKHIIPGMKSAGKGCVIFQASMGSFIGLTSAAGYVTAKSGVLGLVHGLASECGPFGVRVNAIAPGWIETDMMKMTIEGDPERKAKIFGRIPAKRLGDPMDIGMAALFLCSDAAQYINGACIPVDGGALIGF